MVARALVRFIASLILITALMISGGWAYADVPIVGSYHFNAAVNQHADHMTGCLHFDPLGAISGSASSAPVHSSRTLPNDHCQVIISGIYTPSPRGAYQATVTLIPLNFACHSNRMDNKMLHFEIVPRHDARELNLTRAGKKKTLSGAATRRDVEGAAALLACS